jgi:hypothetical protein
MGYSCSIEILYSCQKFSPELKFYWNTSSSKNESPYLIDDLIAKLTELTQSEKPNPKYEVGQEVWHINTDDEVSCFKIGDREVQTNEYVYQKGQTLEWWLESQLYPSSDALIEAQIEYWKSLQSVGIISKTAYLLNECQHESDGELKLPEGLHGPCEWKCKKCGVLYRMIL